MVLHTPLPAVVTHLGEGRQLKIALFYHDNFAVWQFRKGLIQHLVRRGHAVYVICPSGDYDRHIENLGAILLPIPIGRSIDIVSDLKVLFSLYRICLKEKFDIIHNFTMKPNIYGAIAAKCAGIKTIVSLVPGLGSIYSEHTTYGHKLLKILISICYRISFRFTDRVWFQNNEDLEFFVQSKLLASHKAVLIRSSGINLEEYSLHAVNKDYVASLRSEFGLSDDTRVVTMVARPSWLKGVAEFIDAAQRCAKQVEKVTFLLVGGGYQDPQSVPVSYLEQHSQSTYFKWLGFRTDVKEILAISDIAVLPSYYPEGIPRFLLEALAMQKPIITTDSVGCREVVNHGKNGFLIPIKSSEALSCAVITLLSNDEQRNAFGIASRQKARKEFSEEIIVGKVLSDLYKI
jgi:N,N'-diacetylbacillosaminyl-diphospho-undecaprenol alpha-1,3-N-acetylgalactosaminyltransferase